MTYNKPELAILANAIAAVKGDKEDMVLQDSDDPTLYHTASAYQADE
jgi:hypothetical protein